MRQFLNYFDLKNLKYLLFLWIFLLIGDFSFKWYWIWSSAWILIQRLSLVIRLSLIIIGFFILLFLSEYEIDTNTGYKLNNIEKFNSTAIFYRIHDTKISYNEKIETILQHVNKRYINNEIISINVSNVNVWSSDTLRFEFLLFYWKNKNKIQSSYACIMESDFIINTEYFKDKLLNYKPGIAYVQHFWGHSQFEPYSNGIICASRAASYSTQLWVRLMYFLYSKRYRRLLVLGPLFFFAHNSYVFYWDKDKGCTEFYSHCNYIHFTNPKIQAIEQAIKLIQN